MGHRSRLPLRHRSKTMQLPQGAPRAQHVLPGLSVAASAAHGGFQSFSPRIRPTLGALVSGNKPKMPDNECFKTHVEGGVTVVRLIDPSLSDTLMAEEFENGLIKYLDKEQPPKVVVDFEGVSHCPTAVIDGLLRVRRHLLEWCGELRLCSMSRMIREAYRLLNLDGNVQDPRFERRCLGGRSMRVTAAPVQDLHVAGKRVWDGFSLARL